MANQIKKVRVEEAKKTKKEPWLRGFLFSARNHPLECAAVRFLISADRSISVGDICGFMSLHLPGFPHWPDLGALLGKRDGSAKRAREA